jgi:hypothetical protein
MGGSGFAAYFETLLQRNTSLEFNTTRLEHRACREVIRRGPCALRSLIADEKR